MIKKTSISEETFRERAETENRVPVYRTIPADTITPVSAYQKLTREQRNGFLLDSAKTGTMEGRYSFLGVNPRIKLIVQNGETRLSRNGDVTSPDRNPYDLLSDLHEEFAGASMPHLPPLVGGAVGYVGFPGDPGSSGNTEGDLPEFAFLFFDTIVSFDHIRNTATVTNVADATDERKTSRVYRESTRTVRKVCQKISEPAGTGSPNVGRDAIPEPPGLEPTSDRFMDAVQQGIRRVNNGLVEQVTLTRSRTTRVDSRMVDLFRGLRMTSPAPYLFLFETENVAVAGSSPERLVRYRNGTITYQPRSVSEGSENQLRANHNLLVDAVRNDLARLAKRESINVKPPEEEQTWDNKHVLRSTLTGEVTADTGPIDILKTSLPALKQTGFPRDQAVNLIDRVEPGGRSLIGGGVCYLDSSGNFDSCTVPGLIERSGDRTIVRTGNPVRTGQSPEEVISQLSSRLESFSSAIQISEELYQ